MTTYAVRGTVSTPEGPLLRVYTSESGTRPDAQDLLAQLQDVQRCNSLRLSDAVIVAQVDGEWVKASTVESLRSGLHVEGAPSLPAGILAAAFAASSPKPSRLFAALDALNARPAA